MQHFDSQIDKSNFQPAQKAKQKNSNIQTIFRSFSLLVRSAGQIRNRSEWYAIRSKPVAGLTKRVRFWATADQFERSDFRIVFRSLQIHTDRISFFYFKLQAEVNIFKMAKIFLSTIYPKFRTLYKCSERGGKIRVQLVACAAERGVIGASAHRCQETGQPECLVQRRFKPLKVLFSSR